MRGLFVAFEGLDRCGKSTQAQLAARALDVVVSRFPDRANPRTGERIDAFLLGHSRLSPEEASDLFSENRRAADVLHRVHSGETVVADRWSFSGIAYGTADGLDERSLWAKESDLPCPDLVVFLDIEPEVAAARDGFGRERYDTLDLQRKACRKFRELAEADRTAWLRLDATRPPNELHAMIMDAIRQQMQLREIPLLLFG